MRPRVASALAPRTEAQVFAIGREALGNVVKHAQASTAWISVEERPGHVVVEIRDDGLGFEPDVDHPGHFGLESMRSRAAEIGAQLSITSGPGRGTVVRIEAPAEGQRAPRWRLSRGDPIKVLVVDDHAVVRRGLRAFFESEPDLEVVGAADGGTQALELLEGLEAQGRRPDVVVMDLQMRPLNGIESTRLIRARYDDVAVVVLTSYADDELVRGALEAGASGYVLKDADTDEVAAAVRAADRGELQLDPAVARRLLSSLGAASRGEAKADLTTREVEVLRLVGAGAANKEIAVQLGISERTARTHVSNILGKLGLASRTQAALWAVREGLVDGGRRLTSPGDFTRFGRCSGAPAAPTIERHSRRNASARRSTQRNPMLLPSSSPSRLS